MFQKAALCLLLIALPLFSNGTPEQVIKATLDLWSKDFNAKNIPAVCGLFAKDLIASYPGTPDRDFEKMCVSLQAALTSTDKTLSYEVPQIEQIIVQEDLAIVRLIWTLKTSFNGKEEVIKEKGLDVFRKQPDGSWKISISYAYPLL